MPQALDDYLQEWEDRRERGESVSSADLCPDWPEGRAEIDRLITMLEACDRLLDCAITPLDRPPRVAPPVPAAIAGYEVRGELGRGGMGVVYRAWHPQQRREVALKVLYPALSADRPEANADRARRFQREAQVIARLKHEHIIGVLEARADNGCPYYVMECVCDGSLAPRLAELRAAGPAAIVPMMERVARAVHHAHGQGVLHRDLKPSNILLEGRASERRAPVPKVIDFGIAKLMSSEGDTAVEEGEGSPSLSPESLLTPPGCEPGTPAYMAPEQFDRAFGGIGPAADVWSLGVILYELLAGRRPFAAQTRRTLAERICREEPPSPRSVCPALDRRLEAIVLRCLAKDPRRRFASAGELADRLARCRRAMQRRRWVSNLAAGMAVLAVAFAGFVRDISLAHTTASRKRPRVEAWAVWFERRDSRRSRTRITAMRREEIDISSR